MISDDTAATRRRLNGSHKVAISYRHTDFNVCVIIVGIICSNDTTVFFRTFTTYIGIYISVAYFDLDYTFSTVITLNESDYTAGTRFGTRNRIVGVRVN